MLHAIAVIEQSLGDAGVEMLDQNATVRFAVERGFEIVSEASRHLSQESRASEPDVDWRALADLGNVYRHGYDVVEPHRTGSDVIHELPILRAACERLYARVKRPTDPWPDAR